MKFGPVPLDAAEGAVLAHALTLGGLVLKKGRVLSAQDLRDLADSGADEIVAVRYEPGDIAEDAAVAGIAACLAGSGLRAGPAFTGRCNLHAEAAGVLVLDRAVIDALNRIDEAITLATLTPFAVVEPGQIVATIKIIPFAASETAVAAWERASARLRVAPFIPHRIALVQTLLPGMKGSTLEKGALVTHQRVAALGSALVDEIRCPHHMEAVAMAIAGQIAAGAELVLVTGASAIVDRRDVIPAAITAAGGEIGHFGMPVDPGNLLLVGRVGAVPVLGLPGCALA
jgi:molybdenum cofactor cytidylyltransferase